MRNATRPLKEILQEVCREAEEHAKRILPDYGYPSGKWFPCGSADIVLEWGDFKNRTIIKLFKKEASSIKHDFYRGWFGRLFKVSRGFWWMPNIPSSQSMLYEEEVCKFIRDKLVRSDIAVYIRSYVD